MEVGGGEWGNVKVFPYGERIKELVVCRRNKNLREKVEELWHKILGE